MAAKLFSLDDKIGAMHLELVDARRKDRPPGSPAQRHYEILKAIAADLRARQEITCSQTLGELGRMLERIKSAPEVNGYDHGRLVNMAHFIIGRWPLIQQALENFGEESVE